MVSVHHVGLVLGQSICCMAEDWCQVKVMVFVHQLGLVLGQITCCTAEDWRGV